MYVWRSSRIVKYTTILIHFHFIKIPFLRSNNRYVECFDLPLLIASINSSILHWTFCIFNIGSRRDSTMSLMKRVKDAFSVARESPSCAMLCNHWVLCVGPSQNDHFWIEKTSELIFSVNLGLWGRELSVSTAYNSFLVSWNVLRSSRSTKQSYFWLPTDVSLPLNMN